MQARKFGITHSAPQPKEKNMKQPENRKDHKWITVYSREGERKFFFYASLLLVFVYFAQKLLHLW